MLISIKINLNIKCKLYFSTFNYDYIKKLIYTEFEDYIKNFHIHKKILHNKLCKLTINYCMTYSVDFHSSLINKTNSESLYQIKSNNIIGNK